MIDVPSCAWEPLWGGAANLRRSRRFTRPGEPRVGCWIFSGFRRSPASAYPGIRDGFSFLMNLDQEETAAFRGNDRIWNTVDTCCLQSYMAINYPQSVYQTMSHKNKLMFYTFFIEIVQNFSKKAHVYCSVYQVTNSKFGWNCIVLVPNGKCVLVLLTGLLNGVLFWTVDQFSN